MDQYLKSLRETPSAPGHSKVLYAGLKEHLEELKRIEKGIPYHPEVLAWFRKTTADLGILNRFN